MSSFKTGWGLFKMLLQPLLMRFRRKLKEFACFHDECVSRIEWSGIYIICSKCRKTVRCIIKL